MNANARLPQYMACHKVSAESKCALTRMHFGVITSKLHKIVDVNMQVYPFEYGTHTRASRSHNIKCMAHHTSMQQTIKKHTAKLPN